MHSKGMHNTEYAQQRHAQQAHALRARTRKRPVMSTTVTGEGRTI